MLMFSILVVLLAAPAFCGTIHGDKKTAFQRIMEDMWKEKCKNVSGVEVDFERNDRLYQEYKSCKKGAIDRTELRQDFERIFPDFSLNSNSNFTLSHQQATQLVAVTQKYCPKVNIYVACNEKLAPIHNDCYTLEEKEGQRVQSEIYLRINKYLCENGSQHVTNFIDGKVVQCGVGSKAEFMECVGEYILASLRSDEANPIFGLLPKTDKLCNSIETLRLCVVPIFEQCESSQTAGTLVKSFFEDIQTETACYNSTKMDHRPL